VPAPASSGVPMSQVTTTCAAAAALILTTALAAPARADEPRDEWVATSLAVGGTIAPIVMVRGLVALPERTPRGIYVLGTGAVLASVVIGPAAGHWYTGDYWTTGMAVRGVGLLALAGAIVALPCMGDECSGGGGEGRLFGSVALLIGGTAALVTGTGIDLFDAGDAARRHNAGLGAAAPRAHLFTIGGSF
jgi:hypothetical protein